MPAEKKTPSVLLHEASLTIGKGEVSAFAEKWGVKLRTLTEIRKRPVDTGIETFVAICRGLNRSADELLGLEKPTTSSTCEAELRAANRRIGELQGLARKVAAVTEKLLSDEGL